MKLNKKQKRTATIASMAALLAVVLGMGGQTFAKYIETKDVTTQATVAKWGVVISSSSDNFFGKEYGDVAGNFATVSDSGVVVSSSSDPKTNIVAPGTKGEMTFSVTGSAEVKAKYTVSVDSNGDGLADWTTINLKKDGTVVHSPIKWTVSTSTDGSSWTPVTGVQDQEDIGEVTEALAGFTATLNPNDTFAFHCKIEWKWAFEGTSAENTYDTLLGKIKAGTYNPANDGAGYTSDDTINAYLSVTVEQVQ